MNKFCVLSIALLLGATARAGEDFNGSMPMDCKPLPDPRLPADRKDLYAPQT